MKTMYTELLEAALQTAREFEQISNSEYDKQEWKSLRKVVNLELAKTKGNIKPVRKG
jgi:hypothetical protein